jgi:hypothetical protein
MDTVILLVSDPHLTDRPPSGRRDDYLATQARKLSWVNELAAREGAAVVAVTGDWFDNEDGPRIRRSLDVRLLGVFRGAPCPWVGIRGNHDMRWGREDSLRDHPLGVLEAAGILHPVGWPRWWAVPGTPRVLVVGLDYRLEGPGGWLEELRGTHALRDLKVRTATQWVLGLTHCFWGGDGGDTYGEPRLPYESVVGTGIDVLAHGHDHRRGGVVEVEGAVVVGTGALTRQTTAPEDVDRIPAVGVVRFSPTGYTATLVDVPCEPAAVVFDLGAVTHRRVVRAELGRFTEAVVRLAPGVVTRDPLASYRGVVAGAVLGRAERYVRRAQEVLAREGEGEGDHAGEG